ncbi:MAG: hypothetical protein NXI27_31655 [Alphaproteobacteria bacterium]|nr:hypothetical protein [Alphaproteobacteria bacterium]
MSGFNLQSKDEIECIRENIRSNAAKSLRKLQEIDRDPLRVMFEMKFQPIGFHPNAGYALNLVEQINQTFTYLCAVEAAAMLFDWHHELKGLIVYPGAHAPQGTLDIEALDQANFLGAEVFSAVKPTNNRKLQKDLEKLKHRQEDNRYVFFVCPTHKETARQTSLEKYGVHVWSIWPFE